MFVLEGEQEDGQPLRAKTVTRTKKPKGKIWTRIVNKNDNIAYSERSAVPTRIQPKRGLQQSNKEERIPEKERLFHLSNKL